MAPTLPEWVERLLEDTRRIAYQAGLDAALAALPEDMIGAYNKDWLTGYNGGLHDARYAITKLKEPSND